MFSLSSSWLSNRSRSLSENLPSSPVKNNYFVLNSVKQLWSTWASSSTPIISPGPFSLSVMNMNGHASCIFVQKGIPRLPSYLYAEPMCVNS